MMWAVEHFFIVQAFFFISHPSTKIEIAVFFFFVGGDGFDGIYAIKNQKCSEAAVWILGLVIDMF